MSKEKKHCVSSSSLYFLELLYMMLTGGADTFTLSSVGDQAIGVIGTANTYINILKPFITNRLNHIISILLYIFVDKIQARKSNKSPFSH